MAKAIVTPGEKFGRWTVVEEAPRRRGARYVRVRCECGTEAEADLGHLRAGRSQSCGCLKRDLSTRHGHTWRGGRSRTYQSWGAMRARCFNPSNAEYARYGARGVTVCERWGRFEDFLTDMGERPEGHTLDRVDPNGDYEPSNCRWADTETQNNNKRTSRHLTVNGETRTLAQWASQYGLHRSVLGARLKLGWPIERALSEPVNGRRTIA